MKCDSALLVSYDYFDAGFFEDFVQFFHVLLSVGRGHLLHVDLPLTHSPYDALDVLGGSLVAHQIVSRLWRGLMTCHRSVLVVENEIEDVLSFFDRVGDCSHSSPEKRGIAHQRVLFVCHERVHPGSRSTAQGHCR